MNTEYLAAALLRACEQSDAVSDLYYQRSGKACWGAVSALPTDTELAWKLSRSAGAANAVNLAQRLTDPALLDRLARKDSRLGVRRAVASNRHCSRETGRYLMTWAIRTGAEKTADVLLRSGRLDWRTALGIYREVDAPKTFPARSFARLVTEEGTPEAYRLGLSANHEVRRSLVPAVAAGRVPGLSLVEVLDAYPDEAAKLLFIALKKIDLPLAERMTGAWRSGHQYTCTGGGWRLTEPAAEYLATQAPVELQRVLAAAKISPQVTKALLDTGDRVVIRTVAKKAATAGDTETALAALATGNPAAAEALTGMKASTEVSPRIVEVLLAGELGETIVGSSTWARVWEVHSVCLDPPLRLEVLRRAGRGITAKWLSLDGRDPRAATIEDLRRLVEDPGKAFHTNLSYDRQGFSDRDTTLTWIAGQNVGGERPWADGLLDLIEDVSSSLGVLMSYEFPRLLLDRLQRRFGNRVEAHDMFVTMAPTWPGRLDDLLEAVGAATGATAPTPPGPSADGDTAGTGEVSWDQAQLFVTG